MKKKLLLIFGICLIFFSCEKNDISSAKVKLTPDKTNEEIPFTDSMTILGEQLENPYSVKNMRKAMENLDPLTRAGVCDKEIQTTHYYVRFHPKTEDQLDLLKQDSTIVSYSYPLDYDVEAYGTHYHDPAIADSLPTYQYASIEIGKEFPAWIESKILEELYIPDDYSDDVTKSGNRLNEDFIESLVSEAMSITGNKDDIEPETRGRRSWRPSGRITVYDDLAGIIPLKGVKVRARRWFTTRVGYTNSAGYYSCNGIFNRDVNYDIIWENSRWDIRNGWFAQAYYNGPKRKGSWNLYISGGRSLRYATIHRAAYRYYYEYIGGFYAPVNFKREKICYIDKVGGGDFWGNVGFGVLPDIRIYSKYTDGSYLETYKIFKTTIHELAHVSHCTRMGQLNFWQVDKVIYESWADFVEWSIAKIEYKGLGVAGSRITAYLDQYSSNHQNWPKKSGGADLAYSSLFIDLVDDFNQGENDLALPYDEVSGYENNALNMLLLDSYGLTSLKKNVKRKAPSGVTDQQIDTLFEKYEQTKY